MGRLYAEAIEVCMIVVGAYFVVTSRRAKSTKRSDSATGNLVHNGLMALAFVCAWPTLDPGGALGARFVAATPALETIGVALVAAGAGFAIWSRYVLGADWSAAVTIKEGHRLVRRGPYAVVRNPIYTGDITIVAGMALALGEYRGLVGLALMVGAVWHKGRTEERFLLAEFGDEYADYQREVSFLLPFIA
jgi:protein-S-isoprenylcysteine O-methyltransferase Ste14